MPPETHALLSASSAARWLHCTAAPRLEAQFPETNSHYAEEGKLAHAICELKVIKHFTMQIKPRAFTAKLNKLKAAPLYNDEMDKTSDLYIEHLSERAMRYSTRPNVAAEVRVDFGDYVPEGYGTCDCIMIGGDTLSIVDYKHGQGVPVSAENNPQMRLYALGALRRYAPVFGDTIKFVSMTIDQPRIQSEVSTETITVEELRAWGRKHQADSAGGILRRGQVLRRRVVPFLPSPCDVPSQSGAEPRTGRIQTARHTHFDGCRNRRLSRSWGKSREVV